MHIEYIITIVVAVFGSSGFWAWLTSKKQKKSAETKLLLGLAYSEIIKRCEWAIEKGYMPTDDYNDLNRYLFEPYEETGGNGTAARLMKAVRALPTHGQKEGD